MKKMLETLTTTEKISLINGNIVGMFPYIIQSGDDFYNDAHHICLGYYTQRSGEKTISGMYERFIKFIEDNPEETTATAEQLMGTYIRSKFIDKWNLEYSILLNSQYNPLNEYEETKEETRDLTNLTIYGNTTSTAGTDKDTLEYDTSVEDSGETSTKETVSKREYNHNDVYGFNSVNPVHDTKSDIDSNIETIADPEDNTTHNVTDKTGTEERTIVHGKSEAKTGRDTEDVDGTITTELSGRKASPSDLLTKELDFRNKNIFYDIIYRDIDSIATLQIYI